MMFAKQMRFVDATDFVQTVELNHRVFQQTAGIALAFFIAPNQFFAAGFDFRQAHKMQQFSVKSFVEGVAVIGKRQF